MSEKRRMRRAEIYSDDDDEDEDDYAEWEDETDPRNWSAATYSDAREEDGDVVGNHDISDEFDVDQMDNEPRDDEEREETNNEATEDDCGDVRFKSFVGFVCCEGVSDAGIEKLIALMTLVYGHEPPFSKTSVLNELRDIRKRVVEKVVYCCVKCGEKKESKTDGCVKCAIPKPRLMDVATTVLLNVKLQLTKICEAYGDEIVKGHAAIHSDDGDFGRYDIRNKQAYKALMESRRDFEAKKLNLIVTLSSDGALYRRLSRREVSPTLLRVEGLDPSTKRGGANFVLIALLFAAGGLKKSMVDFQVENVLSQFSEMQFFCVVNGVQYEFNVKVLAYIADMKEQQLLTFMPNYYEIFGCGNCLTKGRKKRTGKITFDDPDTYPTRRNAHTIAAAKSGSYGFKGTVVPIVFKYIDPEMFTVDNFHLQGAGVCVYYLNEFEKPKNWAGFILIVGRKESLKKAIDQVTEYTGDTIKLQSLKYRSKWTGRETQKMSEYISAIASFTLSYEKPEWNVFSLAFFLILTFLGSDMCQKSSLRTLCDHLYELYVVLSPDSVTIKFHAFFKHAQSHYDAYTSTFTTESFEREHRNMMLTVHQNTTRCEFTLPTRYIGSQWSKMYALQTRNQFSTKITNNLTKLFGIEEQGESQTAPNLAAEHEVNIGIRNYIEQCGFTNVEHLKRVTIENSYRQFSVCADGLWKTEKTTQSEVCFTDNQHHVWKFGKVLGLFRCGNVIRAVVEERTHESLQETFAPIFSGNIHPTARKVLNSCLLFPTVFAKVVHSGGLHIVECSNINHPACVFHWENCTFVKIIL